MRRLVIVAVVVLIGVPSVAKAVFWDNYYGYGYGYGGIIGQIAGWHIENRKLDIAENELERIHQESAQQTQVERQRSLEWAQRAGKIQHLEDENKRLREENAELKKQLDDMQKELSEVKKMLQKLLESKGGSK